MDKKQKIVLLATSGTSTNIVYNYLVQYYNVFVIIEEKTSTWNFFKNRIRKVGFLTVFLQIIFIVFIQKILLLKSSKRRSQIFKEYALNDNRIPESAVYYVKSVNEEDCLNAINKINPSLILVNGTRIISKKILRSTEKKFLNIHAGITPKYRGVHGGYWALVNNDTENCGVTIHFTDEGIDTGNILYQGKINYTAQDNFTTYPILQLAEALKVYKNIINDVINGTHKIVYNNLESQLWFHPTVVQYLNNFFFKNVK